MVWLNKSWFLLDLLRREQAPDLVGIAGPSIFKTLGWFVSRCSLPWVRSPQGLGDTPTQSHVQLLRLQNSLPMWL